MLHHLRRKTNNKINNAKQQLSCRVCACNGNLTEQVQNTVTSENKIQFALYVVLQICIGSPLVCGCIKYNHNTLEVLFIISLQHGDLLVHV